MSLAELTDAPPMSAEALADLPDDGIERDLIRGELREWPMTRGSPDHCATELRIGMHLGNWAMSQPAPGGLVVSGEAGFRLLVDPVTYVGIDVAYVSAEMAATLGRKRKFFDGAPILAVEILSPSDRHGDVVEKVELYLEVGTIAWVVDPDFRTVAVHRAGRPPELYNDRQELDADDYLPGFRVALSRLFDT